MKPKRQNRRDVDLFRERLDAIIDMDHSLVRLYLNLHPMAKGMGVTTISSDEKRTVIIRTPGDAWLLDVECKIISGKFA